MRVANRITSQILDALGEAVRPGAECSEFEDICRRLCEEHQVRPAFLGYQGYGYALCCSVNSEVVHGFPTRDKVLREGDIVSFDMGVVYKGFYGDSARTFPVGQVRGEAARLMDVTRESLLLGIEQARPGTTCTTFRPPCSGMPSRLGLEWSGGSWAMASAHECMRSRKYPTLFLVEFLGCR